MINSIKINEKRSLIILLYIPILYIAYHISAISFKIYTVSFIIGISCLLVLNLSKNITFKNIIFSFICGLTIFFLGFFLYKM
ncbi:hypothetical protein J2772_003922 [Chryseobacterium jejuense]|nr:hypothetical protein [Chryseobacterium jejuense]